MGLNLKAYEDQAKVSIALGVVGGLALAAALAFIFQRFDFQNFWLVYNRRGKRLLAIAAALLFALGTSAIGFLVALNSASQRRNKRPDLSWTGFFLNAAVIALSLSAGIFFYLVRVPVSQD